VRRLARVIEAELDLHSTFDSVDTGTFRAVPRTRRPTVPDVEPYIGPATIDEPESRA
jgi:2-aminoadipate transaminase